MDYNNIKREHFGERDALTAAQLTMTARISYEQEMSRYSSLVELGNKLLTSITIVFATLAVLLQLLTAHIDALASASPETIATSIVFVVLFRIYVMVVVLTLVSSFITALLSSMRFKYSAIAPPNNLADYVRSHDVFDNETMAALQFCVTLQESYETLANRNEKMRKLLKASMILLIVCLATATVGGLILMFFL